VREEQSLKKSWV